MRLNKIDFLLDVWSFDNGKKVHPYRGQRGDKKGLFSVNFTNNTNNFKGVTESGLRYAIATGKFKNRGTIRMLPLDTKPGAARNAFAPRFYQGKPVKDF